ncbi:hypothetical protein FTUN_7662 [Frigoriglobus tundricola]|uniref:Uncharacterized protein n=1 Tax=Frigoriglobus tundricola TaxID=2774151 RepID=A0A6M5Z1J9_9BACT|nr:hypothetical protein FTUN_7662 [Frigoriglobus tundricola]
MGTKINLQGVPHVFWLTLVVSLIWNVMCAGCWLAFIFADCNEGALAVVSAFTVFTGPMLVGTILILRRRESGMRWLRFGSVVFLCEPGTLVQIWKLKDDPAYLAFMRGAGPLSATGPPAPQRPERPWDRGCASGPPSDR